MTKLGAIVRDICTGIPVPFEELAIVYSFTLDCVVAVPWMELDREFMESMCFILKRIKDGRGDIVEFTTIIFVDRLVRYFLDRQLYELNPTKIYYTGHPLISSEDNIERLINTPKTKARKIFLHYCMSAQHTDEDDNVTEMFTDCMPPPTSYYTGIKMIPHYILPLKADDRAAFEERTAKIGAKLSESRKYTRRVAYDFLTNAEFLEQCASTTFAALRQ